VGVLETVGVPARLIPHILAAVLTLDFPERWGFFVLEIMRACFAPEYCGQYDFGACCA